MADIALRPTIGANPVARGWQRVSPRLVPLLAVLTALIVTVPFMMLTGGRGDIASGLNIAGTAYAALIEGSIGLAINDQVSTADLDQLLGLTRAGGALDRGDLRQLARDIEALNTFGASNVARYAAAIAPFSALDDETLQALAVSAADLRVSDPENVRFLAPFIRDLDSIPRGDARDLLEEYAALESMTPEQRAALNAVIPSAAPLPDDQVLARLATINTEGVPRLVRLLDAAETLEAAGIAFDSAELQTLADLGAIEDGAAGVRQAIITRDQLDAAAINDPVALQEQVEIVRSLYAFGLITTDDVTIAVEDELDTALANTLVVRRPGNRLVCAPGNAVFGLTYAPVIGSAETCDVPSPAQAAADGLPATRPEVVYLRLPGSALLFFPYNLEDMLVRAIPFVIAGLAVALGFKAGVFNIGAEGQMYAGALIAVWVGFSPIFASLPWFVHIPLVVVVGILGGGLWGAVPGVLKAFTGAHEVIVTIMLNYIMIRFVDWIIKSTDPLLLLDPAASTPRTPFINPSAVLPRFNEIPIWAIVAAGVVTVGVMLWSRRARLAGDVRLLIRPILVGVGVILLGLFLWWITVRGTLHIGLLLMIAAVWFTDWFLNRTTPGFELRTVGINPNAARYAGMSVKRNIVLALALSGALAGLAGTIEISGVQQNMKPEFFAGVGFDAIAVALLARSNPRAMIAAGLLWGALLSGAGLMQVRADISIDLVKIIQALIIMFIAADAIIRSLWRVPEPGEKTAMVFSSWGKSS